MPIEFQLQFFVLLDNSINFERYLSTTFVFRLGGIRVLTVCVYLTLHLFQIIRNPLID
jgi:hypothetical protein